MKEGNRIIGSNQGNREKDDFYPTPEWATEALMKREKFEGLVWECACGDGSMAKVIEKYNHVLPTDIVDRGYGLFGDVDFLNNERIQPQESIITNPPYKFAKDFILTAKKKSRGKIAMLLKLSFLEGRNRFDMFQDKEFPLKKVYVFCGRITMFPNGIKTSNASGTIAYAWFVWDKNYEGSPQIEWINDNKLDAEDKENGIK